MKLVRAKVLWSLQFDFHINAVHVKFHGFNFSQAVGQIQVSSTPYGFRTCTSSRGVLETFTCEVDILLNASMSQYTIKSYQSAITLFDSFRLEKQFTLEWPASLDNIISFIAYLSLQVHIFLVFHFISR